MAESYVGEIRIFPFSFAPHGWHLCDGSILPINQNQALFSLLGKAFGGDGLTTFGLPDLRGRTPLGIGALAPNTYAMGDKGGVESVTLTAETLPPHTHSVQAAPVTAVSTLLAGNLMADVVSSVLPTTNNFATYLPASNWSAQAQLYSGTVSTTPTPTAHDNLQPFLVLNFCICTTGYYPEQP